MIGRTVFMVVAVVALAAETFAQPAPAPTDQSKPPQLLVQRIESGWVFVPDVRATDLDGQTGSLAGGYVGRITDRTWVIGGGGYFLTNRDDDFKLAYGGPVVEWLVRSDRKIGFGVRALVGAGSATLPRTLADLGVQDSRVSGDRGRNVRFGGGRGIDPSTPIAIRDDFFVAEPQVSLLWNLTRRYRVSAGVGYRLVGSAAALGDQLTGVSGSVSFHIGGGS